MKLKDNSLISDIMKSLNCDFSTARNLFEKAGGVDLVGLPLSTVLSRIEEFQNVGTTFGFYY